MSSSKFQVPGGVLGEQSSGRLLQFVGQGGAEEWLGLGHILKDSFLHGVPLGLEGGLGFTVSALGFPCPLEVFEVTQHLGSLGKAKSRDGIWEIFFCLLWEAKR